MTGVNLRTGVAIALATFSLLFSAGASAHDDERWEHERYEHHRHHDEPPGHWRRYSEAPPVIYGRRPVMVVPTPVYQAPLYQAPVYAPPMDPSLNFNFTIPLR